VKAPTVKSCRPRVAIALGHESLRRWSAVLRGIVATTTSLHVPQLVATVHACDARKLLRAARAS
jgi:hypothetical protein